MTNEQLAAFLYQLACRMQLELDDLGSRLTKKQQEDDILIPFDDIVLELKEQVKMLTGEECPMV